MFSGSLHFAELMMDCSSQLLSILMASNLDEVCALGLDCLHHILLPNSLCLILWDQGLSRYIIGETWIADPSLSAAAVRRQALLIGQTAHHKSVPICLEGQVVYYPLQTLHQRVGAIIWTGHPHIPEDEPFLQFAEVLSRALLNVSQYETIIRERETALADRERLEHLLQAVDRQQRRIDQLLTAEKQFSAALEAKVEERTTELHLAHQRLIQSEKLAVIGQLTGSLAHEINNPLQAMRSGLDWVLSELAQGRTNSLKQDLTTIQSELERIEGLFRQLLDFYRPTSFQRLPLDLNEICQSAKKLIQKQLEKNNALLQLELTPNLPAICGDGNQIKQVLLNLLLNAAEALPKTGGEIILKTSITQKVIRLTVIDNGHGIPDALLGQLFEPLFTTKVKGLGLGLSISREIIERHQGTISVESDLQQGTTFIIDLPRKGSCDEPSFNRR